jgi:hypothetical protein
MWLIITYKFVKAGLMLGLATWLTTDPEAVYLFGQRVAHELVEARPFMVRLGNWLQTHLTEHVIERSALVAWLDGVTTALEGTLLLLGKPWGEWLVVIGLSLFLPFEVYEVIHKPGVGRAIVLLLNAAIVVYLVYELLLPAYRARSRQVPPAG